MVLVLGVPGDKAKVGRIVTPVTDGKLLILVDGKQIGDKFEVELEGEKFLLH